MRQKEHFFFKFLQDLLRNENLRASFFLMEFLSMADEKQFGKMMKDREKEKAEVDSRFIEMMSRGSQGLFYFGDLEILSCYA